MKDFDHLSFISNHQLTEKCEDIQNILEDFLAYIEDELDDVLTEKYEEGHQSGYDSGYTQGNENGYDVGWHDGRADAYDEGHQEGYEEGYADAKRELPGESAIKEAEERGYKRAILEGATPDVTELI